MSLFDFFFPEQAQAIHLRTLAEQGRAKSYNAQAKTVELHRQRCQDTLLRRKETAASSSQEQRIAQLEKELAQAALALEALTELLEHAGILTRQALATRIQEIDATDGTVDGRLTPPQAQAFTPTRPWPGDAPSP